MMAAMGLVAFYGLVPRPDIIVWTVYADGSSVGEWAQTSAARYILPQAVVFLAAGIWLLLRTNAPGADVVRGLWAAMRGTGPVPAGLLLPVLLFWYGLGTPGFVTRTPSLEFVLIVLGCVAAVTVLLAPRAASIVAVAGLSGYAV
jgi:hypothetical protein